MTTALFIVVGSRGDTEPSLALIDALLRNHIFAHVHICLQSDYAHLVPPSPRLTVHLLPFSTKTFQKVMIKDYILTRLRCFFTRQPFDIVSFQLHCISAMVCDIVLPSLSSIQSVAAAHPPSLVLASSLAANLASTLADAHAVPAVVLNLQPNVPTSAYPNYMSSVANASLAATEIAHLQRHPASVQKESPAYRATYDYEFHSTSRPVVNKLRATLGLAPLSAEQLADVLYGRYPRVHVINSYPAQLVPPGKDWAPGVHHVPALADEYEPAGWDARKACPRVAEFLARGEKPVVVSFGSTTIQGFEKTLSRAILHGLKEAGVARAILLRRAHGDIGSHQLTKKAADGPWWAKKVREWATGMVNLAMWLVWLNPQAELLEDAANAGRDEELRAWAAEHMLECTEEPQYGWLLQRCAGLVCHGGAGTVFAGLKAGVPVVVAPILGDQFFWGSLVQELGLGAVAGPDLQRADCEAFAQAIKTVREQDVRERARAYAEEGHKMEKGSDVAAMLLGKIVASEEGKCLSDRTGQAVNREAYTYSR
ncbi:unnamed protein product [Chondrus crispus]|uniref:Erythromycin biosynthesis protein CIII-like C-terminal domain-containing protein n=1 Tax=Chondrus crispus TaxID=2769 RepID=R7QA07_CHOCR|nr:unnamed protein product [Chondrus crispus]CDF34598.1 unnamed protein product [Chondrus crispus]|eukprot:XP_005714417.1 unnamed protein product [Chondrus crispus]